MIKSKFALLGLLLIFIVSCQTDGEKEGMQEILSFYGGHLKTSKGLAVKNSTGSKHFDLILSNSPFINDYSSDAYLSAGDIALKFWRSVKKENPNYDLIRVTIELPDGVSMKKEFKVKELEEVMKLYPNIEKYNNFFKTKEIDSIIGKFDPEYAPKKSDLNYLFANIDKELGKTELIQFQGFNFYKDTSDINCIAIKEVIKLEKGNLNMYVVLNRISNKIIGLQF